MDSKEFNAAVKQLKDYGRMHLPDGATPEQIQHFESEKGVSLPLRYKEWLLLTDGGELFPPAGVQLYGVSHKPAIDVDEDDRPSGDYVVIGALCTGDPILAETGREQISIYNHEAGTIEPDEIYADFLAFLMDLPAILGIEG